MQRKPQFEEEFDRLIRALASAAGGTPTPEPRPVEGMPGEPEPGEPEKVQTP
jgi:hypothetical protein